jgi:hypothetical protein
MAALASALLVGALTAPLAVPAQDLAPFVTPGSTCTMPPAPESDTWPRAGTDSLGSTAGAPVTFSDATLLANDTGASLTVRRVGPSSSAGGTITGSNPYTYTPAAGFIGPDIFTYEIGNAANQTTVGLVTISITADLVAPSVSISAPVGGTTVSGSVLVRAAASDNVGVAGVTFFDGIAQIGLEVTAPPFERNWDTTLVADGNHDLHAVARDAAGNSTTSAIVSVNVSNAPPPPPPPPPPTPAPGLVLSLGFDEAGGATAIDSSPSGRNGTITGAVRVPGKVGSALSFNGISDWVTVIDGAAGTPLNLTTAMTLEAWVKPTTIDGWETVIMKERGVNALSYALYAHDGAPLAGGFNAPAGYVRIGTMDRAVRGVSRISTTDWTHLATTYDGITQRMYVNGVQVSSRAQTGSIVAGDQPLRIGGNASFAGEFFKGLIDEVKVYNRALTAAEIAADMGSVAPPPPPPPPPPTGGLVLSFSFDEADGQPAIDASSSGRNGVITGAVRVPGKVGRALQFDGIDDWVTVTDGAAGTPLDLTTGMTLEAWVKPTAIDGWEAVIVKELGTNLLSYALYAHDGAPLAGGADAPAGYGRIGGVDQAVRGTARISTTDWTHLAMTYDGTMQRFYVNGVEVGTHAQTGSMAVGDEPLRIGGDATFAGEFFKGLIDEVKVYNRALTAAEINADMNAGTGTP